ncbi:hypothetical protein EE612_000497 [Oryza sativa]|nr:hypothetical protein EE612_000497 [Oryza sativa]
MDGRAGCCVRFIGCCLAADGDDALSQSAAALHRMASAFLDAHGEPLVLLDHRVLCSHGVATVGHSQAFAAAMRQRREEIPPAPFRILLQEEYVGWAEVAACANGNKIVDKKSWRASVRNMLDAVYRMICQVLASAVRSVWAIGTYMLPLSAAEFFRRRLPASAVPEKFSWRGVISTFRFQIFPDTCAIVACSVCIEAQHRLEFERLHGQGTFILELPDSTRKLRRFCLERKAWFKGKGAHIDSLLSLIQETGGVPAISTTNTRSSLLLPLHSYDYFSLRGCWTNLTPQQAAQLIFTGGPCIGSLWVDGSYTSKHHYSDDNDDDEEDMLVYRGCDPKKKIHRDKETGLHAVVCYVYRFIGKELHIRVQDNMPICSPHNWILFQAFDMFYTLRVMPLDASRLYDPLWKMTVPPKISQKIGKDRAWLHANLRRLHEAMMIQKGKEKVC